MVGSGIGSWRRRIAFVMGVGSVRWRRIQSDLESALVAAPWTLGSGGPAIGGRHHRLSVSDSYRTAQVHRAAGVVFSLRAIVSKTGTLAWLRLVPADSWICRVGFRHSAALYFQWKTVLGARDSIRRDSFRTVRQSKPLCGSGGIVDPAGPGHPDFESRAPRPIAVGCFVHLVSHRSVVSVGFPGRHHQLPR